MERNEQEEITPEPITADELEKAIESDDRLWLWLERSGEYDMVSWEDAPVEVGLLRKAARRAASTIRAAENAAEEADHAE